METGTRLVDSTLIRTFYEIVPNKNRTSSRVQSVTRIVTVNGQEVYKDKMSLKMHVALKDPIKKLDRFLSGLEETKSGQDIGPDCRNRPCFFKKVWRKLFCEKV